MAPAFTKSTRDNVTFVVTIMNVTATVLIAVFGYLISSDVRDIQKHADERAKAKEIQEFWSEMRNVSQKINEQSGRLGETIAKFSFASGTVLDEYARIYRSGSFDSLKSDPKYLAAYANYLGTYGDLSSSIAAIGDEYAFLRIRYAASASSHNITGWELFAHQDKNVSAWSAEANSAVARVTHTINATLAGRKDPNSVIKDLAEGITYLSEFLVTRPIPYVSGLGQFLDANWKGQTKPH